MTAPRTWSVGVLGGFCRYCGHVQHAAEQPHEWEAAHAWTPYTPGRYRGRRSAEDYAAAGWSVCSGVNTHYGTVWVFRAVSPGAPPAPEVKSCPCTAQPSSQP